ncbi:asparagine synthase [Nonomuraea sp. WAC 01424]|uniref:asparagine synthase-related protein n=1 Tax=Nonomuraea sp. WAC 01424 TaxID=2203200 RepID=UPI000F78EA9E|nr:asparagine synthase-related protein [Nonomuraea sp. WAC 01424]RSM98697.1 asparagine synthase [Nonomuraea sp. WAC 01424]
MRELSGEEFAVLPDSAAGEALAGTLNGVVILGYASGRPCLLAASTGGIVHAEAGQARLAVIGTCPVTAGRLRRMAARLTCLADADAVAAALPGSFHLVAVVGGRVRVQGTASGTRRVYYARAGGAVVASGRAAVPAALTRAPVDQRALAARLLMIVPPVLAEPLWEGVAVVPPGEAAHLDADGVRLRSWWRAPEPEVPLEEGAPAVRAALEEAVAARIGTGSVVAADLSGGLDSTPVSFLAAAAAGERSAKLITFVLAVDDPEHDDPAWAERARAHLPGEHEVARPDDVPKWFADAARAVPGLDEPTRWLRALARELASSALLGGRGAAVRLTGHGGDEVTLLPDCYLHDLARRHPAALWPHLREQRSRARWPLRACVRALADRRPYAAWLADQAATLGAPLPRFLPDFGWEQPLRLPGWTTEAAADAVREALAGCSAEPYSPLRAQHQSLSSVRSIAAAVDGVRVLTGRVGAAVHAPYLDDHVVAACLAVRLDQRAAPGAYKPLTRAAMRPVMPAECLGRSTKGEFSADIYQGLRRHRDQLLALLDGSLLVERGLADAATLRRACVRTPAEGGPGVLALDVFIAAENWLRALPAHPVQEESCA